MEKRINCSWGGEIAPEEQFLLFSTTFTMHLKLKESNYIFICEMWLFDLFFSSILQIWHVEVPISQSISECPLDFKIMRVNCIIYRPKGPKSTQDICRVPCLIRAFLVHLQNPWIMHNQLTACADLQTVLGLLFAFSIWVSFTHCNVSYYSYYDNLKVWSLNPFLHALKNL